MIAAASSRETLISSRMGSTSTPVLRTDAGAEPVSMAGSMIRIMIRISRSVGDLWKPPTISRVSRFRAPFSLRTLMKSMPAATVSIRLRNSMEPSMKCLSSDGTVSLLPTKTLAIDVK